MIRINCFYQAKEGQYDRGLEAAISLVAKSQKHAGCIAYDAFESATRSDVFCIIETDICAFMEQFIPCEFIG